MVHNAPPKPLSLVSIDVGAMCIAGNLTMNKKLSITHATAKIGGAYQPSWSHVESCPSFPLVESMQVDSDWQLPSFIALLYTFVPSHQCVVVLGDSDDGSPWCSQSPVRPVTSGDKQSLLAMEAF